MYLYINRIFSLLILIFLVIACNNSKKQEDAAIAIPDKNLHEKISNTDSTKSSPVLIKEAEISLEATTGECIYELEMTKQGLVDIKTIDENIMVELKYSTTDNFVGKDVYGCITNSYLQIEVGKMLSRASNKLIGINDSLRLLVYDAARPHSIQKILWNSLPQYKPALRRNYVADPAEGSIHNYGSAIDLTIANVNGIPLDMGTKYDFFGELAYPKLEAKMLANGQLSLAQIENRKLLRQVMQYAGFKPIEYEWWHFNAFSRAEAKRRFKIVN